MSVEIDGRAVRMHDFLTMHMNGLSKKGCFQDSIFFLMLEPNGLLLKIGLFLRLSQIWKVSRLVQNWLNFENVLISKESRSSKSKPT